MSMSDTSSTTVAREFEDPTMLLDVHSSMEKNERDKALKALLDELDLIDTRPPIVAYMNAPEIVFTLRSLPLATSEMPDWLLLSHKHIVIMGEGTISKRYRPPSLAFGWILDVDSLSRKIHGDIEWWDSDSGRGLLESFSMTPQEIDIIGNHGMIVINRYITWKFQPFTESGTPRTEWLVTVFGPKRHTDEEGQCPSYFMVCLYDNETPMKDRMRDEMVRQNQESMGFRDPGWTVRYGNWHWTDCQWDELEIRR